MKTYQIGGQVWVSLVGISLIFCAFMICRIPAINLILFWIVPMVLSSLQLFTFLLIACNFPSLLFSFHGNGGQRG